jgi:hypothetical protein
MCEEADLEAAAAAMLPRRDAGKVALWRTLATMAQILTPGTRRTTIPNRYTSNDA